MLVCGGVSPHPAIIIPEIGRDELVEVKKTVTATKQWASYIAHMDPGGAVFYQPSRCFCTQPDGLPGG